MGLFHRKREEYRAEADDTVEASLLRAMLFGGGVTKEMALQVPTVSGGIDMIAGLVAGTPIKLYRETSGKAQEIKDDPRVRLLNDETGDTLDANQFWRAMVRDYYTGKGGYAYINRERGKFKSIHYVDEAQISIQKNTDPIFKDFDVMVDGRRYRPYQFLKVLRNSKDGATGVPITVESSKLIEVAYQTLCFEAYLVKKGGNKKGFLKSEKALTAEAMAALKEAYSNLYSNSSDNVVVLNRGIDFQESSATSVEMQLNENKVTNAEEFAKIFHISTDTISGKAADTDGLAKLAAIPLMVAIQCALNRDFLLEKEKGKLYWAFDTKELLKGDMKSRFEAYRTALEANFMQPDEVRFAEDMEPLGLNWIRLGLQDVLYDPKTKQIYTPNTNQTAIMGESTPKKPEEPQEKSLPIVPEDGTMEEEKPEEARANPYHDPKNGRFTTGGGKAKKTKYAPSPQRNKVQIKLAPKRYARLCGTLGTLYPGLKKGEVRIIRDSKYQYTVEADGYGGFITKSIKKL
ncbi:MAG: phage portal protein [Firmicutes bacterium]|nr:phage portal protein [Bacillota bacterium]